MKKELEYFIYELSKDILINPNPLFRYYFDLKVIKNNFFSILF